MSTAGSNYSEETTMIALTTDLKRLGAVNAPPGFADRVLAQVGMADSYAPFETVLGTEYVAWNRLGVSAAARSNAFRASGAAQDAPDPTRRGAALRLGCARDRPPGRGPRRRHRAGEQPDPLLHPVPSSRPNRRPDRKLRRRRAGGEAGDPHARRRALEEAPGHGAWGLPVSGRADHEDLLFSDLLHGPACAGEKHRLAARRGQRTGGRVPAVQG